MILIPDYPHTHPSETAQLQADSQPADGQCNILNIAHQLRAFVRSNDFNIALLRYVGHTTPSIEGHVFIC